MGAGLAGKVAVTAIVIGGASGGGVALVEAPKDPPRPAVEKVATPAATRSALPPRPVVTVGARLEQATERARTRAQERRKRTGRREQAAARRDEAISRRDEALARRDERQALRGAPGTRGRGNAAKPVKARKVPGSSRSPRAPAKKAHPVTRKPALAPGQVRKQQRAAATPTPTPPPTPEPAKTPKPKQR
jgi:hypothetical protein